MGANKSMASNRANSRAYGERAVEPIRMSRTEHRCDRSSESTRAVLCATSRVVTHDPPPPTPSFPGSASQLASQRHLTPQRPDGPGQQLGSQGRRMRDANTSTARVRGSENVTVWLHVIILTGPCPVKRSNLPRIFKHRLYPKRQLI